MADALILCLDGYEGPLDLLLDLARAQKIDLARISVLALADQYLAILETVRLELAADWLVMAAWLAWLKSRLLLPPTDADTEEGEIAADFLAGHLRALEGMREAAAWLAARPQLGLDVFARGSPDVTEIDRSTLLLDLPTLLLDLPSLLRAYTASARRGAATRTYAPTRPAYWTLQDAMARLTALLGTTRGWTQLERFLPPATTPFQRRSAQASTLLAGLEMAQSGQLQLRQETLFSPVLVRQNPIGQGA